MASQSKSGLNILEWALVNDQFPTFYGLVLLADNKIDSADKFYRYWNYAKINCSRKLVQVADRSIPPALENNRL